MRHRTAAGCAAVVALAGVAWLRQNLLVVSVTGPSMLPALRPGDGVLVRRWPPGQLRRGAVVVFGEPDDPGAGQSGRPSWVIKRLAAVPGDAVPAALLPAVQGTPVVPPGMILVLGDGAVSRDSRHWGFVPSGSVVGVVVRGLGR